MGLSSEQWKKRIIVPARKSTLSVNGAEDKTEKL